jgi:hypothetical protein
MVIALMSVAMAKIKPGETIGELVAGDVPADEAECFYRCPE